MALGGEIMEAMSLFENNLSQPLAARLRPKTLEEYVGQTHLLGKGKVLRRLIESDQISSMIFKRRSLIFRQLQAALKKYAA